MNMKTTTAFRMKALAAATAMGLAMNVEAVTIPVTSALDSGAGTLRAALTTIQADSVCSGAPYVVTFNIASPPTGEIEILVGSLTSGSPLPTFNCQTTIDGYSQPGSVRPSSIPVAIGPSGAALRIFLNGLNVGATPGPQTGIRLGGTGSVIQGVAVGNFANTGISLEGSNAAYGNFVGLRADGVTPAPNGRGVAGFGINAIVGGPLHDQRNVIGSNTGRGIDAYYQWTVKNNLIGTAADGVTARGNGVGVWPGIEGITVGGAALGEANRIANNAKGISTNGFANSGFFYVANEIYGNSIIGIDLGDDGPTPNDSTDSDNRQNFPVIDDVTYSGGNTNVTFTLNTSVGATPLSIEFFGNDDTLGQGKFPIPACTQSGLTANTSGVVGPITVACAGIHSNVTATATRNAFFGGTSEFSAPFLTPDMSPSTTTLTFGTVPVGGASAMMPLTITNPGPGDLFIDAMSLSLGDYRDSIGGPPPTSPGVSGHYCGLGSDASGAPLPGPSTVVIGPNGSCTLNLIFTPQGSGARNATLTLVDAQSPANGTVINLQGSGSVTPPTVNWTFNPGSVLQNAASTLRLSITNPNGAPFTNPNFTYNLPANLVVAASPNASTPLSPCAGSFTPLSPGVTSFTVNGLSVPTGGTCDFTVDVSSGTVGSYPVTMAAGAIAGTVLAVPVLNAASNTATLTVNAPAAPAVQLTPGGLNFGNVTIGTTSPSQGVTLTNVGTAPLVLGALSVTPGDFSQLSDCPVGPPGLSPAAFCTITVDFTPTLAGTRSADITISSNATPPTNIVPLTGNGVTAPVPIATLTPSSLTFPTQSVGTTSAAQAVTLGNSGSAPLLISSIGSFGDFAQTNNCPPSLSPAGTCAISVTFSPIIAGSRSGDVKVFDNASGSPHIVTLSGTASAPPVPTVSAPSVVSFPTTQVGGVSAPVTVTITNVGSGNLVVSAAQVVGAGYAITGDTCTGATVPLSGTCTITLTFSPGSAGSVIATLRLISNAPSSPTLIGLTGAGTAAPVGTLSATPALLDFGTQEIGVATSPQSVTVTNTGSGTVTVSGVTATGDYSQANNCTTLAAAGTCTITVTFTPSATGPRPGSVSVASNASNSPLTVNLAGSGAPIQAPVIELSASSLTFGNRLVGAGAQVQSVTVRNKGGAPLAIGSFTLTGEFVQTNTCGTTVEPGGTCRVDVGFLPTIPGARFGKMTVTSNASNGTQFVDLAGTGCRFTFFNRTQSLICQ